jgi:hypothetical protein
VTKDVTDILVEGQAEIRQKLDTFIGCIGDLSKTQGEHGVKINRNWSAIKWIIGIFGAVGVGVLLFVVGAR